MSRSIAQSHIVDSSILFWSMTLDELQRPISCPVTLLMKNGSAAVGHYELSEMQGAYIKSFHKTKQ
jgi:hypothetical protein